MLNQKFTHIRREREKYETKMEIPQSSLVKKKK